MVELNGKNSKKQQTEKNIHLNLALSIIQISDSDTLKVLFRYCMKT